MYVLDYVYVDRCGCIWVIVFDDMGVVMFIYFYIVFVLVFDVMVFGFYWEMMYDCLGDVVGIGFCCD